MIFFIIMSYQARADMFDWGGIPEKEILTYRSVYKGIDVVHPDPRPLSMRYGASEAAVNTEFSIRHAGNDPTKPLEVVVTVVSQNRYTSRYYFGFKPGPKINLVYYEKTVFTPAGKKVRTEAYDYTESVPPFPGEMAHPLILPVLFCGLDFTRGKSREFYLWLNPILIMTMKVVVKGEEDVTVPAGTIPCYRLEMEPDMRDFGGEILARVLKPFAPKYIFWMDRKAPHPMVKYQGPFGQINIAGAPIEMSELVKKSN